MPQHDCLVIWGIRQVILLHVLIPSQFIFMGSHQYCFCLLTLYQQIKSHFNQCSFSNIGNSMASIKNGTHHLYVYKCLYISICGPPPDSAVFPFLIICKTSSLQETSNSQDAPLSLFRKHSVVMPKKKKMGGRSVNLG